MHHNLYLAADHPPRNRPQVPVQRFLSTNQRPAYIRYL